MIPIPYWLSVDFRGQQIGHKIAKMKKGNLACSRNSLSIRNYHEYICIYRTKHNVYTQQNTQFRGWLQYSISFLCWEMEVSLLYRVDILFMVKRNPAAVKSNSSSQIIYMLWLLTALKVHVSSPDFFGEDFDHWNFRLRYQLTWRVWNRGT